jgi:hypothetical protein
MINLVPANDGKIEVAHIFRDLEIAFYGAVERGPTPASAPASTSTGRDDSGGSPGAHGEPMS